MKEITKILCCDTETTGLDPVKDDAAVCELGWCVMEKKDGEWFIKEPVSMLVDPMRPIPPQISAVHHLTNEDVEGEPPFSTAMAVMMVAGSGAVLCAFNARFEQQFITTPAVWLCAYKCAVHLAPMAPSHGLQALRYWLNLDLNKEWVQHPHRASCDAYVCAALMKRMLVKMSVEQMLTVSENPVVLPRMPFGKNSKRKFSDIESDYLSWILKQTDMDADVVHSAFTELQRRRDENK